MERIEIVLAGGPALRCGGEVVAREFSRRRDALVLAYLALRPGRAVDADEVADAVWSDELPSAWPSSLRRLVSDVRQWLGTAGLDGALVARQGAYRLDLPDHCTVDVLRATAVAEAPADDLRTLVDAIATLRMPILPGFDAEWLDRRRTELTALRVRALESGSDLARRSGLHDDAAALAAEAVDVDPLRESAYRLAMAAHRDAGRIGAALRAYEACRIRLAEDLGTAPAHSTVVAYQSLLAGFSTNPGDPYGIDAPVPQGGGGLVGAAATMATIGSRTAIAGLQARLAAVEASPHPDPMTRLDLLLELGRSRWALSGATDQLRRISLAAGEAALSLGSSDHLGAALTLASTTTGVGIVDPDTEDLCDRALEEFGRHRPTRVRALALRSEMRAGGEAVTLATEAVALARAERDDGLLLDALLTLDQALSFSPDLAARLAVEEECTSLGAHTPRWRTRPTFEPLTRLQAGDLDWYGEERRRLDRAVSTTTQWEPRFYGLAFGAVLSHLAGELDVALAAADELLAMSTQEVNAVHAASALYLAITRDRGGVGDILPAVESIAAQNPGIASFQAALVLGRALEGDRERAAAGLDTVLACQGDDLARDHTFVLALGLLAEAVGLVGAPAHAEVVCRMLLPYAGQLCAGAHATVVLGTVDSFLGVLHGATGDLDASVAAHEAALALERRIGASLLEARSSAWLAAVLWRRGLAGDVERASALAGGARSAAAAAGAFGVAASVESSLAALTSGV